MKKLVDGQEMFDGQPVELYEGRFTGSFYMSDASGAEIATDDLVTFIVTARVSSPKFVHERKTGELKRQNTMKIQDAFRIDANEAKYLLDNMGASVEGVNDGMIEASSVEEEVEEPTLIKDWK